MPTSIKLIVYGKPEPQGSMKAFVIAGAARVTSSNKELAPYRQQVSRAALAAAERNNYVMAGKHVAIRVLYRFYFERPPSIPKKRVCHVVKPDLDKLIRSTTDALTGILYADDAQIVRYDARKYYGSPARVEIIVELAQDPIEIPNPTLFKELNDGHPLVQRQDRPQDDDSISDVTGW